MADTEAPEQPVEEDGGDADPLRQPVLDALLAELGDAVVGHDLGDDDLWVRVDRRAWRRAAEVLRHELGFDYFCFLSGIDWMPNPELSNRYEKVWDPDLDSDATADAGERNSSEGYDTGRAGGDTRFQVFARLYSSARHVGVTLKADLDDDRPSVESWVSVYRGADWHERETWEMFGFDFPGHPNLRHMYLPGEFEGHPLRKDFPLLSRVVKPWPGLVDKEPIPGEDEEGAEE